MGGKPTQNEIDIATARIRELMKENPNADLDLALATVSSSSISWSYSLLKGIRDNGSLANDEFNWIVNILKETRWG